jgi:hypothetical protein
MRQPKRPRPARNSTENKMLDKLDELAAFEEYRNQILPVLRKMVVSKTPPSEIYDAVKSLAAARLGTIIATELDPVKALSAIREVLDRSEGKPKERVSHEHKLSKLKDEELDSVILSTLTDLTKSDKDESVN